MKTTEHFDQVHAAVKAGDIDAGFYKLVSDDARGVNGQHSAQLATLKGKLSPEDFKAVCELVEAENYHAACIANAAIAYGLTYCEVVTGEGGAVVAVSAPVGGWG